MLLSLTCLLTTTTWAAAKLYWCHETILAIDPAVLFLLYLVRMPLLLLLVAALLVYSQLTMLPFNFGYWFP